MKRMPLLPAALACALAATAAEPPARFAFERAFPKLSFERPLLLATAPGDPRLYVATQGGAIHAFDPAVDPAAAPVFLDLSARISRKGNEEGLLGLAFHPDYAKNGVFYAYYSATGAPRQVLSRFRARADRATADPASEQVLLSMDDPYRNHNGGMLAFGPDGMLYVATGDGGAAGDPLNAGQRLDTLLGKILRLTPEGGAPADNPFAVRKDARPEIWAYGLRNPWRFSFDRATGALWAGDVGQDKWEEVDVIVKGGNYGWRLFEGVEPYDNPENRPASRFVAPVTTYGRADGCSVTGGYVYRGQAVRELQGRYLYADFCTGHVWALLADGRPQRHGRPIANVPGPSSFGEDRAGELYITSFDGGLYKLVPRP